jgi:L-iditol 2-dehydrogenase
VVVIGPGPIGLLAVAVAKALGASPVILTGSRNRRLAIGRELGADRVVNINDENAVEVVRQVTGGIGADYVVECAGTEAAVNQATALRYARDRVEDAIKVVVTNREAGTIARAAE